MRGWTLEPEEALETAVNPNKAWSLVNDQEPMLVLTNEDVNERENWMRGGIQEPLWAHLCTLSVNLTLL